MNVYYYNTRYIVTICFFFFFFVETINHGQLRGTHRPGPEVLFLPESRPLLGATSTAAGRRGRRRGGQHAVRRGADQRANEELHQHLFDRPGRVRPVLLAVRVHNIFRELLVDRGGRLLHLLEVVPVRSVAHGCCQ